jgi:hypothetical protein
LSPIGKKRPVVFAIELQAAFVRIPPIFATTFTQLKWFWFFDTANLPSYIRLISAEMHVNPALTFIIVQGRFS